MCFVVFSRYLTLLVSVVTICTTSLTLTILHSAHTAVFMCFVWISEQTAIISLYNINWLVFVNETGSLYRAVKFTLRKKWFVSYKILYHGTLLQLHSPVLYVLYRCVFLWW